MKSRRVSTAFRPGPVVFPVPLCDPSFYSPAFFRGPRVSVCGATAAGRRSVGLSV